MISVAVNGYGTIGKRVADAITAQPDMTVLGVAKTRPNFEAKQAIENGYALYAAVAERADQFETAGIEIAGPVESLIDDADIVVDATPSGIGAENASMYEDYGTPALFQGGESADLVDMSFNARANFPDANGVDRVRVVSCNTTGLSRIIAPLLEEYGIEKARATLIRRGGDPSQSDRGPINAILPNPVTLPSHHGPDVNTIFPGLSIDTLGVKVPTTLMHFHSLNFTLDAQPAAADVRECLESESRLFVIDGSLSIEGTGTLKEYALDRGRLRGDLWENGVWGESISIVGNDLYLFQAIHQESNVVPENIDAIRAVMGTESQEDSMKTTNTALGVE